jgi:hypothetical protein
MQVGSAAASNIAMEQLSRSIQNLNDLNQTIADKSQEVTGKLLKVAAEEKIQSDASQQQVDLLA